MLWVPAYELVLCIMMTKAHLPSFLARVICSLSALCCLDIAFSDTLTGFLPNEAPMVS